MRSDFLNWFKSQHGPRESGPLANHSEQSLRDAVKVGNYAATELEARKLWDAKCQSALYAWMARDRMPGTEIAAQRTARTSNWPAVRRPKLTYSALRQSGEQMHWTEALELAAAALGLPDDAEDDDIERALGDRWNTDLDTFQSIAEALLPLTIQAKTALGGEVCQGFVRDGAFIVRQKVQPKDSPDGACVSPV